MTTRTAFPLPIETEDLFRLSRLIGALFDYPMSQFRRLAESTFPEQVTWLRESRTELHHPTSKGYPLSDPVDVGFCVVLYFAGMLFFFLLGRLTGKLKLRFVGIIYNFILVVLSLYMAVGVAWSAIEQGFSWYGNKIGTDLSNESITLMRNLHFIFFYSKLLEYFDTYLMLLKQNYHQVSFLHVYHHTSVLLFCYINIIPAPGGDFYWPVMVNSGIHVVMYLYYLLNLAFPEGPVRSFLSKNKLIITYSQMTQFVLNIVQAAAVVLFVKEENFPKWTMKWQIIYMITLLILFGNFFIQSKKRRNKKLKAE